MSRFRDEDLKADCEDSGGDWGIFGCTIKTTSSAGVPMRVKLSFDNMTIRAERAEPIRPPPGADESLKRMLFAMSADPPLLLWKKKDGYHADFFAGAQRGSFNVTKEQLFDKKGEIGEPYLKAVGLTKSLPIVIDWLKV